MRKVEDKPGSKIAIVFNGSPLFSGDAGSGPSNIRRWIVENDWLDAIVALPDQLYYNTGIFTYIWLVTNRKALERRGKVQLIDGTRFFAKMKKSLNNKRNELSEGHIRRIVEIYGNFQNGERARVMIDGIEEERVVSRIFENREFGFLKVTVERPLRMNFEATPTRIARLDEQAAFEGLVVSKKRKDTLAAAAEEERGRKEQEAIRALLATLASNGRYMNRDALEADIDAATKRQGLKLLGPIKKAIFAALGERDPKADICSDSKGRPEPDSEARDTENVPLPSEFDMPTSFLKKIGEPENAVHAGSKLPMFFGPDMPNDDLAVAMKPAIDAYMLGEVLQHVPEAWADYAKTKVGYEIPINRHFYIYRPPRPLAAIEKDIAALEGEIASLLKGLVK